MPKKQRSGGQREKKQIRHLCRQPGRGIGCRFPNQLPHNAPEESEISHLHREFTLPDANIHSTRSTCHVERSETSLITSSACVATITGSTFSPIHIPPHCTLASQIT